MCVKEFPPSPGSFPWQDLKMAGKAQGHSTAPTTPCSHSTQRLRQGFKYYITAFGREYLLEVPGKLLAGGFAAKSYVKH